VNAVPGMRVPEPVLEIARRLTDAGYDTWCVGGAVRDWLMGGTVNDVDLATAARPEEVQRLFRRTVAVGVRYGTVGVLDGLGALHEVTTFRRDVATDGRHAVVEYGVSIEEDLNRRDFTINALAYHPFRREWLDRHGGRADIEARLVRAVGVPGRRFEEDFLRILRMIRFAARFDFQIHPDTWTAALAAASGLAGLSAERVREEWFKGLGSAQDPSRFVALWRDSAAAARWLPELRAEYPFVRPLSDPPETVVLTTGLTTDPAGALKRLKASNEEIGRARALAGVPAARAGSDAAAVRRWLSAAGGAADDALLLMRYRLGGPAPWEAAVQEIRRRGEATSRGQLAVTGDDLRAAGVPAGPELGRILERLLDLVLDDPARNERDTLLRLVRSWT